MVGPAERYVDRRELALLMGVSERTLTRWLREGLPSETWGMTRTRRYLPSQAMAWARHRAIVAGSRDRAPNAPGNQQPKE
jgi:phage terminase Nu1 subunit (DNA packaging protein)